MMSSDARSSVVHVCATQLRCGWWEEQGMRCGPSTARTYPVGATHLNTPHVLQLSPPTPDSVVLVVAPLARLAAPFRSPQHAYIAIPRTHRSGVFMSSFSSSQPVIPNKTRGSIATSRPLRHRSRPLTLCRPSHPPTMFTTSLALLAATAFAGPLSLPIVRLERDNDTPMHHPQRYGLRPQPQRRSSSQLA